jgi:hypothetical protein
MRGRVAASRQVAMHCLYVMIKHCLYVMVKHCGRVAASRQVAMPSFLLPCVAPYINVWGGLWLAVWLSDDSSWSERFVARPLRRHLICDTQCHHVPCITGRKSRARAAAARAHGARQEEHGLHDGEEATRARAAGRGGGGGRGGRNCHGRRRKLEFKQLGRQPPHTPLNRCNNQYSGSDPAV